MKKLFTVLLAGVFFMGGMALAKDIVEEKAKPSVADETKKAQIRKVIEERKSELNGSEWKVTLSSSDPKAKSEEDVLTFQNGQVKSKNFAARGFSATNYTVSIPEGSDMAVWETMQTSEKEGVVFIRGEWKGDQMRGVISQQLQGGTTRDYNFTTAGKIAIAPVSEEKKEAKKEEPALAPAPAKEEAKKEEKKEMTREEKKKMARSKDSLKKDAVAAKDQVKVVAGKVASEAAKTI